MILDYNMIDSKKRYKVMSQSIVPRPIAWIVTIENDIVNAAPFSYFTPLSSNPATCVVSIGHKSDGTPKDTLYNILNTKKATICFVDIKNLDYMKLSAEPLPKDIGEVDRYGIQIENIKDGYPPIIKDTKCALMCDFHSKVELEGNTIPIILEIKYQYLDDTIVDDELNIDLKNIARIGKEFAATIPL